MGFEKDSHTMRMKHGFQRISDLLADPFLNGKALGEYPHQPRQFGDADNVLVGDITNISHPVERKSMVFTQSKEWDRSLNYLTKAAIRLAMTFSVKNAQKLGVAIISFRAVEKRLDKTTRSIFCRLRVQVKAERGKYLCGISFELVKLFIRYLPFTQFHCRKVFNIIGIIVNVHC